jgi:hypothetical protein
MIVDDYKDFVSAATSALTADALLASDLLGWWDLLVLDDIEARTAVMAYFEAEGRTVTSSPAMAGLVSHPYLKAAKSEANDGTWGMAEVQTTDGNLLTARVVWPAGKRFVIDWPGHGAFIGQRDETELGTDSVDLTFATSMTLEATSLEKILSESTASSARQSAMALGRVAASFEILGASYALLNLAVDYAGARHQFDRPIGSFQAVQHLLAWAAVEIHALESVCSAALQSMVGAGLPPLVAAVAKATAGRSGTRVAQHTLQVMGAIAFTAEHSHHRFKKRIMIVDSLFGSSSTLTREIGSNVRDGADARLIGSPLKC